MRAVAIAVALSIASITSIAITTAHQPTFRAGVEAVRVDVLVTDGNRPVAGLTAADFELRDRGVVQEIASLAYEDAPLRVMLVLDVSHSVSGERLVHLKDAAAAVTGMLAKNDRGALMTFSGSLALGAGWTGDTGAIQKAIAGTEAGGATALHDAAFAALTLRDTEPGRTLVLIFSDGDDTASWLSGQAVIDASQRNDAVVYAVVLPGDTSGRPGYRVDFTSGVQAKIPNMPQRLLHEPFLDNLTAETGGRSLNAERTDRLRETFMKIVTEFRSRYLLTYVPRGVDADGWHPIEVRLKSRRGTITARRGYQR